MGDRTEPLFKIGDFTLHSGSKSNYKIQCESLIEEDWECLACMIAKRCKFKDVWGIPEGGLKLRDYLSILCEDDDSLPTLIVDDVLTTGNSMEEARKHVNGDSIGYVVFSRGGCPSWVRALFQLDAPRIPDELPILTAKELEPIFQKEGFRQYHYVSRVHEIMLKAQRDADMKAIKRE